MTPCQPFKPLTQLIQTRWSRACAPPLPSWQFSSQYPSSGCLLMWDWQETKQQTCKNWQSGSADTESCHLQKGQGTSPLSVQWRLEEIQQWIPGTPWPSLETGAGQADHYLPSAHRTLWSECPIWRGLAFQTLPCVSADKLTKPQRPRPSVLPNIHWETSANMATRCWSGDRAVGLGRRPRPDGWICGINQTENLTCTAVDCWRRTRNYNQWNNTQFTLPPSQHK